ncbi:unnamed protein product, partial [Closterium sp. Naga37s-1]
MISSLKRNNLTRESILAGIRSTCDEIRAVESGLINGINYFEQLIPPSPLHPTPLSPSQLIIPTAAALLSASLPGAAPSLPPAPGSGAGRGASPAFSPLSCPLSSFLPSLLFPALSPLSCPLSSFLPSLLFPALSPLSCPLSSFLPSLLFPALSPLSCPLSSFLPSLLLPALSPASCPLSCFLPTLPVVAAFSQRRYLPFAKRRYLVLAAVTEQLSNARVHLVEAARLAQRTGRILVLPKGANSRISLGRPLPICSYWDISRFTPYEWVSPEFYLLAARATLTRPSVGFVWVQSPNMIVKGPFQAGMVVGVGRNAGLGGNAGMGGKEGVGGDRGVMAPLLVHALGHVPCASNTLDVAMPARSDAVINMLHA